MSRRRKTSGPPRCRDCRAQIVFFRSWTGAWRTWCPIAVDGRTHVGRAASPVFAGRAWVFEDLVDELMALREQSRDEAVDEAYALAWYVPHVCETTTEGAEAQ